jgi:hypothetical protein
MTFDWTSRALQKITDNGATREEVEEALEFPNRYEISRSSGRPIACRWQGDRWIYVVFVEETPGVVRPITAFFPSENW